MHESKSLIDVHKWIESCAGLVPLEASTNRVEEHTLTALIQSHPDLRGSLIEAVLGLRIGSIHRPHEIVQQGSDSMESHLHGVVHRMEGDFWNSKYWFRQVNDQVLLTSIGLGMIENLKAKNVLEKAKSLKFFDQEHRFMPSELVDAQATANTKNSSIDRELLQQIAHAEWETLWKLCQSR